MKKLEFIYEHGPHKWVAIARDPTKASYLIDTNEYLILNGEQAILTDPGGMEIFPDVFSAIDTEFNPNQIVGLFASHQDPDIISSLALWLEFNPKLKCYLSRLWTSFVPHFGGNADTFIALPDDGTTFLLGNLELEAIPAHYLHSSGNFQLYDRKASILFSGDVGAALLPSANAGLFVEDFDSHIQYAEGFHRRWMGSESAKLDWCERVSRLKIDMLCPQHGAIYRGNDVERFINWLAELKIGTGIASQRT
ncbi:MBL fold metallo-hydrolase [Methylomonas sp. MED-D]|uniref:Flavoprotein n=1 Tax=Methylomonas koyamae TaxID=702114 RepID=A0A177P413_9GAMM|nr:MULTISPECIES: MBL fold metallo-hydrolase [Methylomonas]MDT4329567.1 MBL fold metallo-hydrolase [Methylomonas sp. MV1]OAI24812.1 flavoprotein [Methylomonas koyamae]